MSVFDQKEVVEEITVSLRNADIFTTTQRGVTTTTTAPALSGTSLQLGVSSVKNIRSVTVNATSKTFGSDYLVDYENTNGCLITFNAVQTGTSSIVFDYGSDKIYPDYPRPDLTISSFPRIGLDMIDLTSEPGGFGNVNLNRVDASIVVYAASKSDVRDYIKAIRTWAITNQNNLYYLKLIKPSLIGPLVPANFERLKDRVFQQNQDLKALLQYEINP